PLERIEIGLNHAAPRVCSQVLFLVDLDLHDQAALAELDDFTAGLEAILDEGLLVRLNREILEIGPYEARLHPLALAVHYLLQEPAVEQRDLVAARRNGGLQSGCERIALARQRGLEEVVIRKWRGREWNAHAAADARGT